LASFNTINTVYLQFGRRAYVSGTILTTLRPFSIVSC